MSWLVLAADATKVHLTSQTRIVAAVIAIFFMLLILDLNVSEELALEALFFRLERELD